MRRAAMLTLSILATAPAVASAAEDPYAVEYKNEYENAYTAAYDVVGSAVGRNIVDDGLAPNGEAPSRERVELSTARLVAMANPAPVVEPASSPAPAETSTPTYSGGVSNSTVMCESGGDYGANTGNGYYGGYQFDSQTWDAYGDASYGEANEAPPAVQDAAAASVPYDAWPNC